MFEDDNKAGGSLMHCSRVLLVVVFSSTSLTLFSSIIVVSFIHSFTTSCEFYLGVLFFLFWYRNPSWLAAAGWAPFETQPRDALA